MKENKERMRKPRKKKDILENAFVRELEDVTLDGLTASTGMVFVFVKVASLFGVYGTIFVVDEEYAELVEDGIHSLEALLNSPSKLIIEKMMDSANFPPRFLYQDITKNISIEIKKTREERLIGDLRMFCAPSFYTGGRGLAEQDAILFSFINWADVLEDVVDVEKLVQEDEEEKYEKKKKTKHDEVMYG